jgi:hypothetical protein
MLLLNTGLNSNKGYEGDFLVGKTGDSFTFGVKPVSATDALQHAPGSGHDGQVLPGKAMAPSQLLRQQFPQHQTSQRINSIR